MTKHALVFLGLTACIQEFDDTNPFIASQETLPDWELENVVTGEAVSPSNFTSHVSAYYFGHAT